MMKIYYQLEEIDPLLSLMASFSIFLKRNKLVSSSNRQAYQNFISVMNRLLKMRKNDTEKMREKILATTPLADRKWFLEVLDKQYKASTKAII